MKRRAALAALIPFLIPVLLITGCGKKKLYKDAATEALAVANAVAESEEMAKAMAQSREYHLALEKAKAEAEERAKAEREEKAKAEARAKEEEAALIALEAAMAVARETGPPRPEGMTPVEMLVKARELLWALKYREAAELASQSRRAMPHDPEPLLLEARLRYELDEPKPGLDLIEEALSRKAAGADAFHTYVRWAAQKGQAARAASFARKLKEENALPQGDLAVALLWLDFSLGAYNEAAKNYTLLENGPEGALFRIEGAAIKLMAGDVEGAKKLAEGMDPGLREVKLALAEIEKAQGMASNAEAAFRELLLKDGNDYAAKVDLGILKLTQGDVRQAAKLFEEATVASPGRSEARINLGIAKRMLGDHGGARKIYEEVLGSFPENPRAIKNLAILLEKYFGDNEAALNLYRRYLLIAPEDKEVERYAKSVEKSLEKAAPAAEPASETGEAGK